MKKTTLKEKLKSKKKIILDGAMGTEIQRRGISTRLPLWSAESLLTHPEIVVEVHKAYIDAGADIITTNTFRTTERVFKKVNKSKKEAADATILAAKLAREAADSFPDRDVYIAGSIAPLEDCYSPELTPPDEELYKEHEEYANNLKEGGVDFILLETMITLRETKAALEGAAKTGLPVAVSFCVNKEGNLLSGESLQDAVTLVSKYNPLFISFNCIQPSLATSIVKKLISITNIPVAVYANGDGVPEDNMGWEFKGKNRIEEYANNAKEWEKAGVQIIGGCCGTSPEYIKQI